jgi:hypothetical protein
LGLCPKVLTVKPLLLKQVTSSIPCGGEVTSQRITRHALCPEFATAFIEAAGHRFSACVRPKTYEPNVLGKLQKPLFYAG